MHHHQTDDLIAQLESLRPCDLTPDFEYRLRKLLDRQKAITKQADEIFRNACREVTVKGYTVSGMSWQNDVTVLVFSQESLMRKLPDVADLVEAPAYQITATYAECNGARGWQITKTEYAYEPLAE